MIERDDGGRNGVSRARAGCDLRPAGI